MTDFKMGSDESTLATGRVRGSGEVMNKYVFVSNNSENVSIEDQFLFTKVPDHPRDYYSRLSSDDQEPRKLSPAGDDLGRKNKPYPAK